MHFGLRAIGHFLHIGHVEAVFRYPVKSMRGEPLESANLGWHGLDLDRRLAFRRHSDFPWLVMDYALGETRLAKGSISSCVLHLVRVI
jgi:hypothetical protein